MSVAIYVAVSQQRFQKGHSLLHIRSTDKRYIQEARPINEMHIILRMKYQKIVHTND